MVLFKRRQGREEFGGFFFWANIFPRSAILRKGVVGQFNFYSPDVFVAKNPLQIYK